MYDEDEDSGSEMEVEFEPLANPNIKVYVMSIKATTETSNDHKRPLHILGMLKQRKAVNSVIPRDKI